MIAPLLAVALFAQGAVFHSDAALVSVPVLVTDSHGVPVRDLQASDFRLFDNGAPREIRHVWFEDELPLTIGIIVDISASQRSFLREHRAAVDSFLARLLHTGDRAFVVMVNEHVTLEAEYVGREVGPSQVFLPHGPQPLGEPCGTLSGRSICGGTALWNAVYAAAQLKLNHASGAQALLILSDGNDTGSIHHLDEAVAAVHRAGAIVYSVRYPDPLSGISGDGLTRLATESGGVEFAPAGEYGPILDRIALDLRAHYVLGISPGSGADPIHLLRVEVTRPNLNVRARRQYYVRPE